MGRVTVVKTDIKERLLNSGHECNSTNTVVVYK